MNRKPVSLLLGVGACPRCGEELDINGRCCRGCLDYLDADPDHVDTPKGRDHKGFRRSPR